MTTSSDQRNPIEALAEEFLDRKRRGEQADARGIRPGATRSWPTRSSTCSPRS